MGHHIITMGTHHARFEDSDLELARHYVLAAIDQDESLAPLRAEIESWECIGPGVWLNESLFEALSQLDGGPELMNRALAAARAIVSRYGECIPVDELRPIGHAIGVRYMRELPVRFPLEALDRLEALVETMS